MSQNDPAYAAIHFAGGDYWTFANGGCYVTDVAMVASQVYPFAECDPPRVAKALQMAECFRGAELVHPQRITAAYPLLEWPTDAYYNRSGDRMPAQAMQRVHEHLEAYKSLIVKVDYRPENYYFNMHFVLLVEAVGDEDFVIIDPLDGQRVSLLERYGDSRGWSVEQALFGYRALRPKVGAV